MRIINLKGFINKYNGVQFIGLDEDIYFEKILDVFRIKTLIF